MAKKERLYTSLEVELIALYVTHALNADEDTKLPGMLSNMDVESFASLRSIREGR